jgi:hypothetical protein
MRVRAAFFALLGCLALLVLPATSQAIIIRHDKADSRYRVDETRYPQLFFLHQGYGNKRCMGTLVSPHWAITAAHCARETPMADTLARQEAYTVNIARRTYQVTQLEMHPQSNTGDEMRDVDLALLRLDRDVEGVVPVLINHDIHEVHQVLSLLGWGFTGIGTLGLRNNDGHFRRAENRVEEAGQWLTFRFDDPREIGNQALDLEGIPSLGDSGGPALLETQDGLVLMGIALGELEEGESPPVQGLYGTIQLYERVSSHLDWIRQVIAE